MPNLLSIARIGILLLALAGAGEFFISAAFAQKNDAPAAPAPKYYAAGYGVAILGVVLGLVIVLRPGTRGGEDDVK